MRSTHKIVDEIIEVIPQIGYGEYDAFVLGNPDEKSCKNPFMLAVFPNAKASSYATCYVFPELNSRGKTKDYTHWLVFRRGRKKVRHGPYKGLNDVDRFAKISVALVKQHLGLS